MNFKVQLCLCLISFLLTIAKCQQTSPTTTFSTSTLAPPSCQDLHLTPVRGSCSKYFVCSNNRLFVVSCQSGLVYYPYQKTCLFGPQSGGCADCQALHMNPVPGSCSRFFQCTNQYLSILSCPLGTLYSTEANYCLPQNLVNCVEPTTPAPTTTAANNICSTYHLKPVPNTCNRYYVCSNNQLTIVSCQPGFAYDSLRMNCIPESSSKCNPSLLSSTLPTTTR